MSAPVRARACRVIPLALAAVVLAAEAAAPVAPPVGAWATYRWTSSVALPVPVLVQQTGPGGQVTWSVTQESATPSPLFVTYGIPRGDRKTYTLQIVTHERLDGPPLSVTQTVIDTTSGKAVRSVIQRPKGIIATPESGVRPLREAEIQGPREEVTVPSGRFTAVRGSAQGAQVWVADGVPGLGLVKAVWPSGTLELVRSATSGAPDLLKTGRP